MPALTPKTLLLEEAGYIYHFERAIYFNRRERKAFSREFVEDNSINKLRRLINSKKEGTSWSFYFNSPPTEELRRDLERTLR